MPKNPLVEVFGYPVTNMSPEAVRHRQGRLCPYHNSSGINCTKNSATNPLGVCTVVDHNTVAITCPVRMRQDYLIVSDAADFFFPVGQRYIVLTEVRLNDRYQKSAGNIDMVLAALNERNEIIDFGALEVQAVYISGNVSRAFHKYMENPTAYQAMEWPSKNYPKADYLSSSRKRLAPQLIYKGGILNGWGKKIAVAVHSAFFEQLPPMAETQASSADIAWFVYDLDYDRQNSRYNLKRAKTIYTNFKEALDTITNPAAGDIESFVNYLQERVKRANLVGSPPPAELAPVIVPLSDALSIGMEDGEEADLNRDTNE